LPFDRKRVGRTEIERGGILGRKDLARPTQTLPVVQVDFLLRWSSTFDFLFCVLHRNPVESWKKKNGVRT